MQNLFIEGHKMLLQKFPKQFLYCPRFLLKTVTKCAPEISETLFTKVFPDFSQRRSKNTASEISETTFINKGCSRFLLKTVTKCCFRNTFYKVFPDFSQRRSKNAASEISETTFINKGCSRFLLKTVTKCCFRNFRSS